jgi:hypothetical protein
MEKNIRMVRGDTLAFGMEIPELTIDLSSVYFTCKRNATDEKYIFQKSLEDGVTKIEDGKYKVRVAPEDTQDVEAREYYYDLQIGINTEIYTVIKGRLKIEQDVTF